MGDAAGQHAQALQFLSFHGLHAGALEIGYIDVGADVACKGAAEGEARNSAAQHPAVVPVRPAQPVFDVEVAAGIKCRTIAGVATVQVIGVDTFGPAIAQFLFQGPAREDQPRLIEKRAELVGRGNPHHDRRRVSQIPEEFFTFAQRRLGLLALGDIETGAHQAGRLASLVEQHRGFREQPTYASVRQQHAEFGFPVMLPRDGLLPERPHALPIVRMNQSEPIGVRAGRAKELGISRG